jgi:hypothetical protein
MILILFLLIGTMTASAAEPFSDWQYHGRMQALQGPFAALPLAPRNLDLSERLDLSDYRVVDTRGTEVPYAVVYETEKLTETNRKGIILNREFPDPSTSRITVDFGASVTKNKITVETEGNNFRRSLRVEGSDDLHLWATILPEAWIIAAGDAPEKRFESFDIGSNTYRYLRISVSKMPEENKPPEIKRVSFLHKEIRRPQETSIKGSVLSIHMKIDGTTYAELDFGSRNLSMQRFRLLLGRDPDRIFEKRCELFGRNSLQHAEKIRFESGEYGREQMVETSWEALGSGTVYRTTQGTLSLELNVPARFRFIQIRIENGNSPPLSIDGVEAITTPVYLVFEPAGQSRFDIYTGNKAAPAPSYESAKALQSMDVQTLIKCPFVELAERSGVKPAVKPKGQSLVWIVLAIAVLCTTWIFWNTARSIGKEHPV